MNIHTLHTHQTHEHTHTTHTRHMNIHTLHTHTHTHTHIHTHIHTPHYGTLLHYIICKMCSIFISYSPPLHPNRVILLTTSVMGWASTHGQMAPSTVALLYTTGKHMSTYHHLLHIAITITHTSPGHHHPHITITHTSPFLHITHTSPYLHIIHTSPQHHTLVTITHTHHHLIITHIYYCIAQASGRCRVHRHFTEGVVWTVHR